MSDLAILGGRWRAALKYPNFDLASARIVGWGAGEMFDLFYPRLGLAVDYTVCPWTGGKGIAKHGVPIRDPKALLEEDPDRVLVVVFAGHWAEILKQIGDIGPFRAVRAVSESLTDTILRRALTLAADTGAVARKAASRSGAQRYAIVMQGPIYAHWTRLALRWNRAQHPGARLILSTWEGQDVSMVEECRSLADDLVVSRMPSTAGFSNRNAQILSSRRGLEAARDLGIPYSIKSRSDQFLTGEAIDALFDVVAPVAGAGGAHRIGVHFGTSWKYIPFQMSDQLQGGRTQDLLCLWECPEDTRSDDAFECAPDSHFQRLRSVTNESYVWERYATSLGLPTQSLADSHAFVRDCLFPLDAYAQPFSLKGVALFDVFGGPPELLARNAGRQLLSPGIEWWMLLQANFARAEAEARRVEMAPFTVREFWTLKVR